VLHHLQAVTGMPDARVRVDMIVLHLRTADS